MCVTVLQWKCSLAILKWRNVKTWTTLFTFFTFFWHDTSKTRKSRVFEFSKKRKNVFSNYDRGSKGPPIGNGIWAIKWSRVLWDSIVGYPSDSLASCQYIIYVGYILRHQMSRLYLPSALCNVMIINDIYRAQTSLRSKCAKSAVAR